MIRKMSGMFGRVTCPNCTLVVTSQTNMLAYVCAEATKSSRPSRLMQKAETSGLMASNRLFSGRKNCCLILGTLPSGFCSAAAGSWFSSMKTMRLEAEYRILSRQSMPILFLLSYARRPITCSNSSEQAGSSYSSLSIPCVISGIDSR